VPQEYLPGKTDAYYSPTGRGREKIMKDYLQKLENMLKEVKS